MSTHDERVAAFPVGSQWWWAERGAGRKILHLSLVEVIGHRSWCPDVWVRSIRSNRQYGAGDGDLLPLSAFQDPTEVCWQCGKARAEHNGRHRFVLANTRPKAGCDTPGCSFLAPICAQHREEHDRAVRNGMPPSGRHG